tara:strand:- start:8515 stop:8916 length:402 start_codon:yes stop_codon:yes gene_type:complete
VIIIMSRRRRRTFDDDDDDTKDEETTTTKSPVSLRRRVSEAIETSFRDAFKALKTSRETLGKKYDPDDEVNDDDATVKRAKRTREETEKVVANERKKSPMGRQMREHVAKKIAEATMAVEKKKEEVKKELAKR